MISLYYTLSNRSSREFLAQVLSRFYSLPAADLRTGRHGKPYLESGPCFSLSHSGSLCAVAVGDTPMGLDIETVRDIRPYARLLSSFTLREREEIGNGETAFFANWTAKESYIKYLGETLALARRLAYYGGKLYRDEQPLPVFLTGGKIEDSVFTLCTKGEQKIEIIPV